MNTPNPQGQPQNLIAPIRSVRIQNFRSVRDLTIDLAPDVTVFFGANAAGKTTLLEALAIGLGAIVARVPKATGLSFAKHGDIRVPWKERPDVEVPACSVRKLVAGNGEVLVENVPFAQGASGERILIELMGPRSASPVPTPTSSRRTWTS
jgi:hypothetical protein